MVITDQNNVEGVEALSKKAAKKQAKEALKAAKVWFILQIEC